MSFLTGSHAYGTPHAESDIDLVVLLTENDLAELITEYVDGGGDYCDTYGSNEGCTAVLRFGVLNLICLTDERDYEDWRAGTEELIARRPVTRDDAVACFKARFAATKEARQIAWAESMIEIDAIAAGLPLYEA